MTLLISFTLFSISLDMDSIPLKDTLLFQEIARLPYYPRILVVCGDADHDGLQELYLNSKANDFTSILEFTPDMNYDTTRLDIKEACCFFLSDLDQDHKTELCLAYGAFLSIYESQDSASLPRQEVWRIPAHPLGGGAVIGDMDADSALEIIWEDGGTGSIHIYECVGDDTFVYKTTLSETLFAYSGFNVCPDIDRDGKPEIFAGWWDMPFVVILEAVYDNFFRIVKVCSLPLSSYTIVYAVTGAPDIDKDGKTEALVMAVDFHHTGLLAVFESPGNDSFEMVWHTYFPAGFFIEHTLSVGDVDGDLVPEIAVNDGVNVLLFRCIGDDQYEQFEKIYTDDWIAGLYDLNNDGKAEVICRVPNHQTVIYQYGQPGFSEYLKTELKEFSVYPSVVHRGQFVRINGLTDGSISVFDAAGKTVGQTFRFASGRHDFHPLIWQTATVTPGTYFIRIQLGTQSITRKVLVIE